MNTLITKLSMQGFKSFNRRVAIPFLPGVNAIAGPNGSGKSARYDLEVVLANGDIQPIGKIVNNQLRNTENKYRLDDGLITFENGENLKVMGLNPYTMEIEEKRILAFIKRKGYEKLYKLKTPTGKEIVTTGDHPVMVFQNGSVVAKKIEELKKDDLIATPRILKIKNNSGDEETVMEFSSKLNDKFARMLGYLIGDGYIAKDHCDFTNSNQILINDFIEAAKQFGLYPKVYTRDNTKVARISSKEFSHMLHSMHSLEKLNSASKFIPTAILFSKEEILGNFIGALFDCDGHVRKDVAVIEYATKSNKLAKHVQLALLRFGIISSIRERLQRATNGKMKEKKKYYYLYIEGKENLSLFYKNIQLRSQGKLETLMGHVNNPNDSQRNQEDIMPRGLNTIIKALVNAVGINVKAVRKDYPVLSAYTENRCNPTKNGISKILPLVKEKLSKLEGIQLNLTYDVHNLIDALDELNIRYKHAEKNAGLSNAMIANNWLFKKSVPRKKNLDIFYNYVKSELSGRIQTAKNILLTIEKLVSSDVFWEKIKKIETVKGEKWVYDLSVPECHNFVGNLVFVHNSNVLDAVAFVLGRTSAKSLRADRLHELIFHGGNGRSAADFASVTLTFDNSKKTFPVEGEELSINRKVNQKGVTVYKLNDRTVTRDKILQTLNAARIHPDGQNIILQGDVTEIIEMNPVERREIIDDISGIAEYNDKKEKAQKDLDAVDLKLKEAEIIITQRYDIFKKLEEERNAAIKYQNLHQQLKVLKGSLANKKAQTFQEQLDKFEETLTEKMETSEKLNKELQEVESDLEIKEKGIREVADKLIDLSKRVEIEKEISELRSQMLIKKDKIDSNIREVERLNGLIEKLQAFESRKAELVGEMPRAVRSILAMNLRGVHGTVGNNISVPEKYQIAIEVAAGPHFNDIIVDDDNVASYCIEYLRRERIGRATFLPLNKIKPILFREMDLIGKHGVVGVASKLIKYDTKFMSAVEFVFGNTLVVDKLDSARAVGVGRTRMVTLDGDLIERSGAMIGGHYIKSHAKFVEASTSNEIDSYIDLRKRLQEETGFLKEDVEELEKKLKKMAVSEETREFIDLEKLRIGSEQEIDKLRERRKKLNERRLNLEIEINRANIDKARLETELQNAKTELQQYGQITFVDEKINTLENFIMKNEKELATIGLVNLKSIEEFDKFKNEFEGYKVKYEKILEEKKAVLDMIMKIEEKRKDVFFGTLNEIKKEFNNIFAKMLNGSATLDLEDPNNLESGLLIKANPKGKTLLNIDAMSGGEKSLTALAFIFSIQSNSPSPFYILDEIDAALDKVNSKIVADMIKEFSKNAQFIMITHNDTTIKAADQVYGCSMIDGESKIMALELPKG